jgi:hypothetical protein
MSVPEFGRYHYEGKAAAGTPLRWSDEDFIHTNVQGI